MTLPEKWSKFARAALVVLGLSLHYSAVGLLVLAYALGAAGEGLYRLASALACGVESAAEFVGRHADKVAPRREGD